MAVNREELRELCKKLNLYHLSRIDTFDIDIKDKLAYVKYLLEYELTERHKKVMNKNRMASHLPKVKGELKFNGIDEWNFEDVKKLKWLENNMNLIIIGKCGSGKTALATTLGNLAIEKGYKVYYIKVDEYLHILNNVNDYKEKNVYAKIKESDLIILDELMYLPMSTEDVVKLYRSIMYLSEVRSFIFITNRRLQEWIDLIEDRHTMETVVDRIANGSRQIFLN